MEDNIFDMAPDTIPEPQDASEEHTEAVGTPTTDTQDAEADNTQGAVDNAQGDGDDSEPTGFTVRYNHETRDLSRDEAVTFAQKGLRFDAVEEELSSLGVKIGDVPGMMSKLDFLASVRGTTTAELIDSLLASIDDQERARLEGQYDDPAVVEVMLRDFQTKNRSRYEEHTGKRAQAATQEKESLEAKIARDFAEFQKDFPEIEKYADLPKDVIKACAEGKDLMTAYLLHQHRQDKAIQKQKQVEKRNRQSGTGAIDTNDQDDGEDAFLRGLMGG